MGMYSFDQALADVRNVYEQLTGLPAPAFDVKNPRFPFPTGVDPVALVQSEINYLNLFLINSGLSLRTSKVPTWAPATEVYETPDEYVICMEVPGITEDDVTVEVVNGTLIARGARRFRRVSEEAKYHSSERVYGAFERLFPVPARYAHTGKPQVKLSNGLLEILFPKGEDEKKPAGERSQKVDSRKPQTENPGGNRQ